MAANATFRIPNMRGACPGDPRMSICPRHCFLSRGPPASMWRMFAPSVPRAPGACRGRGLPLRRIGSALVLVFLLVVVGGGRVGAQPATPVLPAGAVTIPTGEEQATVVADQILQLGGATDLMIAVANVEITRGQSRLLDDIVYAATPRSGSSACRC
jgi:hypothetical protein